MADTTTSPFGFTKPEIGASEDTWGTKLNANWEAVDNCLDGTTAIKPNLTEGEWKVGGTTVTSTAAELNILDGATLAVSSVTATATELNYNDGASPGTVAASKTVVADASSKIPLGSTWKVYESGGYLYFEASGVGKAKLDSSGNMTITGSITAGGAV